MPTYHASNLLAEFGTNPFRLSLARGIARQRIAHFPDQAPLWSAVLFLLSH